MSPKLSPAAIACFSACGFVEGSTGLSHPTLAIPRGTAWWTVLTDWCAIDFTGPDAKAFLQSQLTNDVHALSVGQTQWQGWCNAKGRMQASFGLYCMAADHYRALIHASLVESCVKRLKMFVLRSKVSIQAAEGIVVGGVNSGSDLSIGAHWQFADGRFATLCNESELDAWVQSHKPLTAVDTSAWTRHAIEVGVPFITIDTYEHFVPQMVHWDKLGGVNFKKGCYPGQEIVARSHYLGQSKRGLWRFELTGIGTKDGDELDLGDGRHAEIVNSLAQAGRTIGLAVGPTELNPVPTTAAAGGVTLQTVLTRL